MDNIPNEFLCPITLDIMKEPMVMPDGHTYEKEAIKMALERTMRSPLTKMPMKFSDGVINYSLKSLIEDYVKKHHLQLTDINEKIKNLTFDENEEATKVEFEDLFAQFISKTKSSDLCKDSLHVCMRPKKVKAAPPVCLICVVDVSGSMNINCAGNVENMESVFISRLDLIKHSLKTIISTLRKEDMISIIKFNSFAEVQVEPTVLVSKEVKDDVISKLDRMDADGATNLWGGIKLGIDTSASIPFKNYQKSIMVFTDGDSNTNPPKGVFPTLKGALKLCQDNFTISTFSFGNDVGPELLIDIANLGNGIYGYCPDGTMVGTIFINYMANLLSTITPVVKVIVTQGDSTKKTMTIGPLYRGVERNAIFKINGKQLSDTKVTVELPLLNQQFDVPINEKSVDLNKYLEEMAKLDKKQKSDNNQGDAEGDNENENKDDDNNDDDDDDDDDDDEMLDQESDEESDDEIMVGSGEEINPNTLIQEKDLDPVKYEEKVFNQILRNRFIILLNKIIKIDKLGCDPDENAKAKSLLQDYFDLLKRLQYKTKFVKQLIIDIEHPDPNHGQVEKALQLQFYSTWGKCYLSSFLRFHQFEQCGNFKDQSLQYYSHQVFNLYRKMANTLFINLPPPVSVNRVHVDNYNNSNNIYHINNNNNNTYYSSSSSRTMSFCRARSLLPMSNFINRRGGCFNGDAMVLLADGNTKRVRDLKKGDRLNNGATVQCLIEQDSKQPEKPYMCNIDGVLFTPYHPICKEGQWYFPNDLIPAKPVTIDSWFNLILNDDLNKKYEVEFENGIKAITLGHHRQENSVLKHPYFGSDLVLKDLEERDPEGYSRGYIHIQEVNYRQLQYDDNDCCINYYKVQTNHSTENNNNNTANEIINTNSELVY